MAEVRIPDIQLEERAGSDGPPWWGYDPVTDYRVTGTREHVEQVLNAVREAWMQGYAQGVSDRG